jgi:hypothetical protein
MKYDMGAAVACTRERGHSEDIGIDGRIILKFISKKSVVRAWTGFMWRRIGTSGGVLFGIF